VQLSDTCCCWCMLSRGPGICFTGKQHFSCMTASAQHTLLLLLLLLLLHAQVAAEGRRNKVPLEKGFSQVDWLRVARSGADLTGVAC
jgi:hypothetical protein